jgi:orotidine-5'-phosphate decarboxylase
MSTQPAFADRLIRRVRVLGHPLCLGLDPHLALLPPLFRRGPMRPGARETAAAAGDFCVALLDRAAGRVAAAKPQSAFFEALGPAGAEQLARVVDEAHRRGLLVILDAKRGDVGSTAEAYAAAYVAPGAPLACDALTVNPYLGLDALEPFAAAAQSSGAGLFVLVRTSNPGSRDLQELPVGETPLYERVAASLVPLAARLRAPETEWSSCGVVVGASHAEESRRVRRILPRSLFLVPGYGAQGGSARDAVAGFVAGPDGRLEGGVVNASRSLAFPEAAASAADAKGWERAIDAALTRAIDELCAAIEGS